ncbi:tubulin-specific chaperone D [Marchantia polymorpha subsp. ruderalis]|uniref:Tubulin-specific chaperone D n=2 Tax=Marchantia polymorpha TaxID=3197 RepID=A0AAF6B1S2_MARPO|nr:hypothetical protein MARPO_0039s0061 [Marchantia polymorpha]BBN05956.1 hypothetical protein Mp_3g17330 [Marchantia polymorpha subsp. ruderalis]|eukprot:PTQ40568.1 hypothetical protein MARPO_0039s0061 [Marchantia polymorpha]
MDHPSEDDDSLDVRLARSFVQEARILSEFVCRVKEANGEVNALEFKKMQTIIVKYQEQGQLLEPHLEGIISPLMETLQNRVVEAGNVMDVDLSVVKKLCSIVHTLMTVCGYKTVVKFFPHQACDLEVTVSLLERCHQEVTVSSILKEESTGDWETKCTLLLWLSILVLIPFDMASVDTALADCSDSSSKSNIPPLVQKIINICKDYLQSPGPVREMSGVLLSRLLTRPDMRAALKDFVEWSREALRRTEDEAIKIFLIPGVVGVLAAIYKVGGRDMLLDTTLPVWQVASQLATSSAANRSPLLRKLLIKLMQRVSLMHLPPRIATWRYTQSSRSLAQNLAAPTLKGENLFESDKDLNHVQPYGENESPEEEELDVPEIIEEVIEQLLTGLRDKDTVVRWSAAKGVGLVTGRLTLTLADEVVGSVLELFRPIEGDGAWHGGCLALAELARRGLLLPARLSAVVPVIIKALHYDVRKGPHSVGSHVRDAAAYVSWAFARAYSFDLMRDHFKQLAPALLTVACYDREVNCRRAAAAAFQEGVGRQGDFEHGIDIVNAADYFSLGTRSHAYCTVSVYIAQFEDYRLSLIDEILNVKISHWEKSLRELAAEALSLLVKYDPQYFESHVLETLVPWTLSGDLCQRHGATLGIAEVIRALHDCSFRLTAETEKRVAGIVPAIEKARLYRGKGGEIMRAAVSRLIECTAILGVPIPPKIQKVLHDSIDENLKHPNGDIQSCAVAALKAFIKGYLLSESAPTIARTTSKYLQILKGDANPAAQRGAALALGALPYYLLEPVWKDAVDVLCAAIRLKGNPADDDAETRVNAVRGLTSVSETLCYAEIKHVWKPSDNCTTPLRVVRDQVMKVLFHALDDYAIDNRGDVGSWVREAAMEGIERCTYLLCGIRDPSIQTSAHMNGSENLSNDVILSEAMGLQVVGGLAKQAVEKIDRVRDVAGRTLQRLLFNSEIPTACIPHKEELREIFSNDFTLNWAAPAISFPRLVQLLKFPGFRSFVLSGLVIAIGGLADSLGKVSGSALVDFLNGLDQSKTESRSEEDFCRNFDWLAVELGRVLVRYAGNDRGAIPTLKTIDILFGRGIFSASKPLSEQTAVDLLTLIRQELRGCKDVAKLLAVISILSHFASLEGLVRSQSVEQLLNFLFHRYPKVRKVCAEQLYLLLLQMGEQLVGDSAEAALEVIGETCWDGPIDGITADRDQLYGLFRVEPPPRQLLLPSKSRNARQLLASTLKDENESYSALVDAAGY